MQFARYTNEHKIENNTATFRILYLLKLFLLLFNRSGLADSMDKTGQD